MIRIRDRFRKEPMCGALPNNCRPDVEKRMDYLQTESA